MAVKSFIVHALGVNMHNTSKAIVIFYRDHSKNIERGSIHCPGTACTRSFYLGFLSPKG
jgi:hypothetical protein